MTSHLFQIDDRHLNWLRHLLRSGRFRRVLEVGSYRGFSTQAFLEALDAGTVDEVHVCEPRPTIDLHWRIAACRNRDQVHLHQCPSTELLDRDTAFDLIFLDGDHNKANVLAELDRLIPARVPLFVAHDVGSAGRYEGCDGPQFALQQYQADGYLCCVDQVFREGERTERGLLVAARDADLYQIALAGYRATCMGMK